MVLSVHFLVERHALLVSSWVRSAWRDVPWRGWGGLGSFASGQVTLGRLGVSPVAGVVALDICPDVGIRLSRIVRPIDVTTIKVEF